jgi:hypothetical protein
LRLVISTVNENQPGMANLSNEANLKMFLRFMKSLCQLLRAVDNLGGQTTADKMA